MFIDATNYLPTYRLTARELAMKMILKAYKPASSSVGSGQVLQCPYPFEKARLVMREMADALALDLVDKGLVTNQLVLTVGYDIDNLRDPALRRRFRGEIKTDRYGRAIPKHAHGTENLPGYTASTRQITGAALTGYGAVLKATGRCSKRRPG